MKKMVLALLCFGVALHAASSSGEKIPNVHELAERVMIDTDAFTSQKGLATRCAVGYPCYILDLMSCGFFSGATSSCMRTRLKEKDLVIDGVPLAQSPYDADKLLDAFVKKHDLSVCPFKSNKELNVNGAQLSVVSHNLVCSPLGYAFAALPAGFSMLVQAMGVGPQLTHVACACCTASTCAPFVQTGRDSAELYYSGLIKCTARGASSSNPKHVKKIE